MYTKLELTTIFKNCSNYKELYEVSFVFTWLFKNKLMPQSFFISQLAQLRFRDLTRQKK